jgi:hypothetical protein
MLIQCLVFLLIVASEKVSFATSETNTTEKAEKANGKRLESQPRSPALPDRAMHELRLSLQQSLAETSKRTAMVRRQASWHDLQSQILKVDASLENAPKLSAKDSHHSANNHHHHSANNDFHHSVNDSAADLPQQGGCCHGCDFDFSADFSLEAQGSRGWHYQFAPSDSDEYEDMEPAKSGKEEKWQAEFGDLASIKEGGVLRPSKAYDAIVSWEAPSTGHATISGTVQDRDTRCGDGIHLIIKDGAGSQLWSRQTTNTDETHNFTIQASLQKGERVYIRCSYDGDGEDGKDDDKCDVSAVMPTIAFQEMCSTASKMCYLSVSILTAWLLALTSMDW